MPVKPINTAHILHYVMQVWVLIPISGIPLRIQEHTISYQSPSNFLTTYITYA